MTAMMAPTIMTTFEVLTLASEARISEVVHWALTCVEKKVIIMATTKRTQRRVDDCIVVVFVFVVVGW